MLKKMTCRISRRAHVFFQLHFKSPTAGGEYAINSQRDLMRKTLDEVAGVFHEDEMVFFCELFQGTEHTPELAGEQLAGDVLDALTLEGPAWHGKYQLGTDLVERIEQLPVFTRAALEVWAAAVCVGKYEGTLKDYARGLLESSK